VTANPDPLVTANPDPLVTANPSSEEYLTDVKLMKSFAFIYGKKTVFLFFTYLKDLYTTMTLYRSSDKNYRQHYSF